jgi:DNA-binding phage protein
MRTLKKPKPIGQTTKAKRSAKPTTSYQATLREALKDPAEAVAYLNAALEEDSALNRESLYRVLSPKGNPRLSTLGALLDALGLRLAVEMKAA